MITGKTPALIFDGHRCVGSDGDLYRGVQAVDWPSLFTVDFTVDKRFTVHFSGTNAAIRNSLHRDRVMLSIDLSGSSLHQRGYRDAAGQAPLKENLAAAIVLRSGLAARHTVAGPDVRLRHAAD